MGSRARDWWKNPASWLVLLVAVGSSAAAAREAGQKVRSESSSGTAELSGSAFDRPSLGKGGDAPEGPVTNAFTIPVLPQGKTLRVFFSATVNNPFPNSVTEVASQATLASPDLAGGLLSDDPDVGGDEDPTVTSVLAAPNLAGATMTVDDSAGNNDGDADPGERLSYAVSLSNTGNGDDVSVNVNDALPAGMTLDLGSISVILGGGASGAVDNSGGNTVDITVTTVPGGGGSVTVLYEAVVDATVAAGLEVFTNTAQISSPKTPLFDTTQADIPIDADPAFTLTKDDGGGAFDPGTTIPYTLTLENTGLQDASGVVIDETVPAGTTFDAGASTAGWSCADGDPEGTPCQFTYGLLAAQTIDTVIFAVEVVPPQDAPDLVTNDAAMADDGAGTGGVPVEAMASDTTPINDLLSPTIANIDSIKLSGDGTLEECENVFRKTVGARFVFSEEMDVASVLDPASWQIVGAGPDLDLSTTACGPAVGDDVLIPIDTVDYEAADLLATVLFDEPDGLIDGPYRVLACSGPGGLLDEAGNELDGDGDFIGGDDFVRQFRVDANDRLARGHFDCDLGPWVPVVEFGSSITHDPLTDIDDALVSGSAAFEIDSGAGDLSIGQCVPIGSNGVYEFSGSVNLDTTGGTVEVLRACDFFSSDDCTGTSLPTQAFFDTISTSGVWTPFAGELTTPPTTSSALCSVTLRSPAGLAVDAFVDDVSLLELEPSTIFEDGFESGDTSAWSNTIP